MSINPWWVHHCAGTLEEENDPYSDHYKGFSPKGGSVLLALVLWIVYSLLALGGVFTVTHVFFERPYIGALCIVGIYILYVLVLIFTFSKIDFF